MASNGNDGQVVTPFDALNSFLVSRPQEFLQPTLELQQAAVQAAKAILDPLATGLVNTQTKRRDENRKKRKRGEAVDEEQVLQLRQVYTKGFGVKQVWEQAKRVLDAANKEVEREASILTVSQPSSSTPINGVADDDQELSEDDEMAAMAESEEDDLSFDEEDLGEDDIEDSSNISVENVRVHEESEHSGEEENIEDDSDVASSTSAEGAGRREQFIQDRHGLNDGFFSIDDFNKQTQFLEQMDARGDEDNPSDEDEIDWDADPMSLTLPESNKNGGTEKEDNNGSDSDEGPTFGDVDLNASDSEIEDVGAEDGEDMDDMMGLSNANEIRYADFFEPPPKKPSKTKRMRALPKTQPPPQAIPANTAADDEMTQKDIERAIADVRRDLLDSDEEAEEDGSDGTDGSDDGVGPRIPKTSTKNMSTHEKQRAEIANEIRRLEAASVSKRDWQLQGEARAADRPFNSLIEEDLEFERAGKPVPVVTAETSTELEQLIKKRILARDFDEIIRRLPDSIANSAAARRGRVEVDDQKSTSNLAEIYEQDHLRSTNPNAVNDQRSTALKKQHQEIDILWSSVREQLDLLSNLHFKPKRPDIEMKTVEDKPRIAMEDARPAGDLESGQDNMLAPQEIYKPGVDTHTTTDQIVTRGGTSMNREELTREEKLRRRRREKERIRKAAQSQGQTLELRQKGGKVGDGKETTTPNRKRDDQANIVEDLRKGGVKVIGKGGELQSLGKDYKKRGRNHGGEVQIGLRVNGRNGGDIGAGNLKL